LRPSPSDGEPTLNIPLENLNLDPTQTYAGFDFWEQRPLGLIKDKISVNSPEAFQNRIIALTLLRNPIELIGSSRHISMDVISVKHINYQASSLTIALEGIPGTHYDYWFIMNGGTVDFSQKSIDLKLECTGGNVTSLIQGCFLKCTVSFENKDAELILRRS
jgi:hypothetical protein